MINSFKIFENMTNLDKELFRSIENNDLDKVKELVERCVDIEIKDDNNNTPLNKAVYRGYLNIIRYLVEQGADVNTQNYYGTSPLHKATLQKQYYIVEYLIENGADINLKNKEGFNAIDYNHYLWSRKHIQELFIKQNPLNISILKKHNILHPDIKDEYYDLDLGSDLGTI